MGERAITEPRPRDGNWQVPAVNACERSARVQSPKSAANSGTLTRQVFGGYRRGTRLTTWMTAMCVLSLFLADSPAGAQTLWTPWHDGLGVTAGAPGSYFGQGEHTGRNHYCIDFNRTDGRDRDSEVLAASGGNVESISYTTASGWGVRVRTGERSILYLHLLENPRTNPGIQEGQYVLVGDTLGILGFVGPLSSGPHLHFCHFDRNGQSIHPGPFGPSQSITSNPTTLVGYHPISTASAASSWHPNGTLIKLRDGDPTLWLVDAGRRRGIPSLDVLNSHRLNRYRAIGVDQRELNAIPAGDILGLAPTIRLKQAVGTSAVYRITDTGHRQLFASAAAFTGLGYSFADVWQVGQGEIASHPDHPTAPVLYAPFPDGSLVQAGGTVWVIADGRRRGIASETAFRSLGYSWDLVLQVEQSVLDDIPVISPPIDEATTGNPREPNTPTPANITSPAPGSTLPSSTATFTWVRGVGTTWFDLNIGSTPGGRDLFDMADADRTSVTVTGLPTDSRILHLTLWSWIAPQWHSRTYSYVAARTGEPTPQPSAPTLTTPQPGSQLTSSTVSFSWTAGVGTGFYDFNIGSTPGGRDIFDMVDGSNRSVTVSGLPRDGRVLHMTLWSWTGSTWNHTMYTYHAQR